MAQVASRGCGVSTLGDLQSCLDVVLGRKTPSCTNYPAICDLSLSPPPLMVFVNILESLALLQEAQSCSRALHNTLIHAASNALLIFWPTAIQKKLCSAFYEKAQKAFKYLNGKLHSASCSQTILDTNSALSKLSKTVSLQLHYILSTPWNRDSLAQLWFTLFWARFIETRNFLCII